MDYFHLISAADYPCKRNEEFDKFFEHHNGQSFMLFDSEKETIEWRKRKYPDRYRMFHFHDQGYNNNNMLNLLKPFIMFLQRYHIYLRRQITNVYAGWNWFSWNRKVVEYALSQIEEYPNRLERMRYCTCIDEIFFHTMLHDVADKLDIVTNNSLRYIDWHPARPSKTLPLVLDERDYEAIIDSNALFCRKVQPGISDRLIQKLEVI